MTGGKYWGAAAAALTLMVPATAPAVVGETSSDCPSGPAQVIAMVESDRPFDQDDNSSVWEAARQCDWRLVTDGAANGAISQFLEAARDNGLAGGLRTFARNGDFRLYLEGADPMGLDAANNFLDHGRWLGTWRESSRGSSPDATWLFAVGDVRFAKRRAYQYAQVWQFDPKVSNWGVRLLLLHPLTDK